MNEMLYETLAKAGLLRAGVVNRERLNSMSLNRLRDLAIDVSDMTSAKHIKREHDIFALSASLALSGGRERCGFLDCRIERVQKLMQFAVLYTDKVYVRNNLVDWVPSLIPPFEMPEAKIRGILVDDLTLLNEMRPAIEKGLVIPTSPHPMRCPHCLVEESLGQDAGDRFKALERRIRERYQEEVSVTLQKEDGQYVLLLTGPDSLIDHGQSINLQVSPDGSVPLKIRAMPRNVQKADRGESVLLSRAT